MSYHFQDFVPAPRRNVYDFTQDKQAGEILKSCPTRIFSQFEHFSNLELLQKLDAALQKHGLPAEFPEKARDHHVVDDLHAFVVALEHTAKLNAMENQLSILEIEDSQALRRGSETLSMLSACFSCRDRKTSSEQVIFVKPDEGGKLRRVQKPIDDKESLFSGLLDHDTAANVLDCQKWGQALMEMRKQYQALSIQAPRSGWQRS